MSIVHACLHQVDNWTVDTAMQVVFILFYNITMFASNLERHEVVDLLVF